MKIVVCAKQIIDPEIPAAKFRVDERSKRVIPPEGIPPVINPYDAQAVELGLRLKEAAGGSLTVLAAGEKNFVEALRYCLAMGADEAILIEASLGEDWDGFLSSYLLCAGIGKIGPVDLVLCGRQAADWDRGIIGPVIAASLGLAFVTLAKDAKGENGKIRVEKVIEDGFQIVECCLPALLTVGSEIGKPRIPSGFGIITAARKSITTWSLTDIRAQEREMEAIRKRTQLVSLYPLKMDRKCEMIKGKDKADTASQLALRISQIAG